MGVARLDLAVVVGRLALVAGVGGAGGLAQGQGGGDLHILRAAPAVGQVGILGHIDLAVLALLREGRPILKLQHIVHIAGELGGWHLAVTPQGGDAVGRALFGGWDGTHVSGGQGDIPAQGLAVDGGGDGHIGAGQVGQQGGQQLPARLHHGHVALLCSGVGRRRCAQAGDLGTGDAGDIGDLQHLPGGHLALVVDRDLGVRPGLEPGQGRQHELEPHVGGAVEVDRLRRGVPGRGERPGRFQALGRVRRAAGGVNVHLARGRAHVDVAGVQGHRQLALRQLQAGHRCL